MMGRCIMILVIVKAKKAWLEAIGPIIGLGFVYINR
jgi:hypothetical protein